MITGLGCSSVADCMLTCSRPWIWSPAQKKKKARKKLMITLKAWSSVIKLMAISWTPVWSYKHCTSKQYFKPVSDNLTDYPASV